MTSLISADDDDVVDQCVRTMMTSLISADDDDVVCADSKHRSSSSHREMTLSP